MSERIHGLAQLLPEKTSLEDCSLEELQHLTKRFPYFAPAQFLLLQKLKETGSPDFEAQHRKAALYFPEPLLFDYFISADKYYMDEAELGFVEKTGTFVPKQPVEDLPFTEPEASVPALHISGTEPQHIADNNTETSQQQTGSSYTTTQLPPPPPLLQSDGEALPLTEPDRVTETETVDTPEPAVLQVLPLPENGNALADVGLPEVVQNEPETAARIVAPPSSLVPVPEEEPVAAGGATKAAETVPPEKSQSSSQKLPKNAEPLAFEPFHTVDYFASQGIKISSDALPKDKLSHQLRSFTEWLKVMKRLPAAEMETAPQTTAEKTVESLASHSVKGSDVVTEAMAEVWARQGNHKKAIETYNKLSLLNPSKKAYFAAKIENLSRT